MPTAFVRAARHHWPEALIEGAGLALFMAAAIGFTIVLEHPDSPVRAAIPGDSLRRFAMGCAMGTTLLALVYSPFGARSGAHFNPVFTLTYWRLGKIDAANGLLYGLSQFAGAAVGVAAISTALPMLAADSHVRHAATTPGAAGVAAAFLAEVAIAFLQMSIVLAVSNSRKLHAVTGVFAAVGVALYITFEAPLSGMSMNPARTLGSALAEGRAEALWLYFSAPLVGMLLAAELHLRRSGCERVYCGKLNHAGGGPCLFRCRYPALVAGGPPAPR